VPGLRDVAVVVLGYGLAFASLFVGVALVSLVQVDTGTNQAAAVAMENPEIILLLVPASILLIGPGEEALFRGVVQGRLREVFDPVPGILIPSAIFAGLHFFAPSPAAPSPATLPRPRHPPRAVDRLRRELRVHGQPRRPVAHPRILQRDTVHDALRGYRVR